ncbi:MAG: alkaline phosphatase family protein [Candidatus Aminicenantes bacterium]|nr:alkaline phosphatase family protein [Candidatus Aminicenantes bacterium]
MMLFKKKKKRVCVIGLDGVPHSLLVRLAESGIMPAAAELIRHGHLHRMKASLPEISAVSWTDFMTGLDSGNHGIFGFTDLKPRSYELRFPNFRDVKAETFWDALGRQGRTSIVVNQPSTYPARPIPGSLVSGFVALELAKAVSPPSHRAALEKMGYQVDIDTLRARQDASFFWSELDKTFEGSLRALDYFWKQEWDFFEFVVTGTDRLHHFHWTALEDESHPFHRRALDYYRRVDTLIGDVARRLDGAGRKNSALFLLSDHGFTGIEQEVSLNAWLEQQGFLEFAPGAERDLRAVTSRSRAFALDPNRIHFNRRDRFPEGSVGEADSDVLKAELRSSLSKLECRGRKVVRRVFDAAEIYHGPFAGLGPDLVVLAEPGFDMKGSARKKDVFGRTPGLEGMHTWDDAVFLAPEECGTDLKISDLASILLMRYNNL